METFLTVLSKITFFTPTISLFAVILCSKLDKRNLFFVRILSFVAVSVLMNRYFFHTIFDINNVFPYFLVDVIISLLILLCYRVNVFLAFFLGTMAHVLQHMLYNIDLIVSYLFFLSGADVDFAVALVKIVVEVILGVLVFFYLAKNCKKLLELENHQLLLCVLTAINIIFTIVLSGWAYLSGFSTATLAVFRVIICLCFLSLPFVIYKIIYDKRERQALEAMLSQSEKLRTLSKDTSAAINRKCHDLKYQIAALKNMTDKEERNEVITQLESDVMFYDAIARTGNNTLDVVLTEKSIICDDCGIYFTYMADGERLSFIKKSDIYTLFGNALDNAIEAVRHLDKDKRIVSLMVNCKNNNLCIKVENYCDKQLSFIDGLPQTTKQDTENHGFGTRSIRYIVEKYGGEVFMTNEDNMFTLNILFLAIKQLTQ